jgi:tRNA(Met) cytidine acetyltransferase
MHATFYRAISILDNQITVPAECDPFAAIQSALQRVLNNRHRLLIVLSGSHAWCQTTAYALADVSGVLWIGDAPHATPAHKARQCLGSECPVAVFDAHTGLHPDALAAVAGTVVAGGALVLLVPPLADWADTPDPDYRRLASYPRDWQLLPRRFLAHIRDSLWDSTGLLVQEQDHPAAVISSGISSDAGILWPGLVGATSCDGIPSPAQQQCLHQLEALAGVSVLLAGRGHGKSALLGFAAREWLAQGKRVLLVAPSRAAAKSVFLYAGKELAFSAPDALLLEKTITADVLLIDEAAAIPLPMLFEMLARFSCVLLATTTDGYEGTGQGFVLRFLRELDRNFPKWQRLALDAPVRWADNDPLERWLYRALLLDAQEPSLVKNPDLSKVFFERIEQSALAGNPSFLADIYGLLRSAHYRTTPDDLRFLLDAPAISIYRLAWGAQTLAVALVVEEGSIDERMALEISAGRRRPRGHLLVQTLAIHEQQPQYLQQRVARVIRIAVHTQLQGNGLGSQLLQRIVDDQRESGVQSIGSSFSATPEVLSFWQRNGFELVRLGYKKQAASAAPSALVLRHLPEV